MLDIETMSTAQDAVIVSIGAVRFDMATGEVDGSTYIKVDKQSCINYGLRVDSSTVDWWFKQNKEAQEQFLTTEDRIPLYDALLKLSWFINRQDYVWGNGINFDCAILRNAYKVCEIPLPWDHFKERDVRTLVHFKPEIKDSLKFEGAKHHPIADCLHQIKYCNKIYSKLLKC